jgi:hypothetical protein
VIGLAALVNGCCVGIACEECAPAIRLRPVDAVTGQPVAQAAMSTSVPGDGGGCYSYETTTDCTVYASAGIVAITLSAPGYQSTTFQVVVPASDGEGCCDCGYEPVSQTVELAPSS